MYSFYYCSGSLERAFFKSCSLLWGLEAFYLLIKLSKVEHEQAIYAKHLQTPSKIKKAKLHTRWEQECKKKHSKTKKTAHPIGASLLFDSLAMGVADLCFFLGGLCGFWPFGSKNAKNLQRRKKLHTSTIHLFRLQALHCTDIFFVMFWLLIFRGLTRVVWTWNIYITLKHFCFHK